jgi:hypothetical protein
MDHMDHIEGPAEHPLNSSSDGNMSTYSLGSISHGGREEGQERSPEAGNTSSRPIVISDSEEDISQMAQLMMDDHDGAHSGSDANQSESFESMLIRPQGQRPMAIARMCRQLPPVDHSMMEWQEHLPRRRRDCLDTVYWIVCSSR